MFRFFVPLLLLATAVATLLVANSLATEPPPASPQVAGAAALPLLSAQRLPTVPTTDQPPAPPPRTETLERDLTALAVQAPARSCIAVRQGGENLFALNADEPLTPASLQKLATAEAALSALGADYTYRTTAIAEAPTAAGILPNDLYLVGGGDPLLATPEYEALLTAEGAVATPLDDLAADLVSAGLIRISGGVIAVENRYENDSTVASWPDEWLADGAIGTLNPIALNQGYQTPEGIGGTAGLLPEPEPALRTAALFDDMLEARSVAIPERPNVAAPERDFSGYVELAAIESAPLGEYLRFMLSESDNTTAELVLKEIGLQHTGTGRTLDGALAVLELLAAAAGRPILVFPPQDGSGLSPENELTCAQVIQILEIGGPEGTLASYLPVTGVSGTLRGRFVDSLAAGRVRAKTGSLTGVASLAGFAEGADGRPLTFAVILNDETLQDVTADAFLQQFLEILVSHPEYAEDTDASGTD